MSSSVRYVPLDADQMQRFHAHAPQALARRGKGFIVEQWITSSEMLLVAIVGLVGILALDWSAEGALSCLLVGVWARIIGDLMKYLLARGAVVRVAGQWADDAHVWLVAPALMRGEDRIQANRLTPYVPGAGLAVDIVFGGIATAVIAHFGGLLQVEAWQALLAQREWRWLLFGMLWWQLTAAALSTLRHAWMGERAGPIPFTAGPRGLGLFLLMFPIVMLFGEDDGSATVSPRGVMLVINVALLLLSLLMLFGSWLIQRETRWLARYLASRPR